MNKDIYQIDWKESDKYWTYLFDVYSGDGNSLKLTECMSIIVGDNTNERLKLYIYPPKMDPHMQDFGICRMYGTSRFAVFGSLLLLKILKRFYGCKKTKIFWSKFD